LHHQIAQDGIITPIQSERTVFQLHCTATNADNTAERRLARIGGKVAENKLAHSIAEVSAAANVGRTKIFKDIELGLLRAVKNGSRTIVLDPDLRSYLENLPAIDPKKKIKNPASR
jgi:hypothetical protein